LFEVLNFLIYYCKFDKKFEKKKNTKFVFYDYEKPEDIEDKFIDYFDFVMIDPPFITEDV